MIQHFTADPSLPDGQQGLRGVLDIATHGHPSMAREILTGAGTEQFETPGQERKDLYTRL